jgi:hypothetical protein
MTDDWGHAAEVGGEFVKPAQLNGHLVIVYPIGYIPFIQTRFSGQGGKPSDGIAVDVVDLDDKNDQGMPGKIYRNSNFMQAHLIAALKSQIGSKVLGMISQGVAKNGMNAPWIIVDLSADPAARERGSAWIAANPDFRPTPFVLREPRPEYTQPAAVPYQQPQQSQPGGGQFSSDSRYGPDPGYGQRPAGYPPAGNPQFQQPAQQQPQYQQPAPPPPQYQQQPVQQPPQYQQPQQNYAPVAGSPQLDPNEMSVLQQHRAARAIAEAEAQREAQRQASFNDTPPF